MSDVFTEAYKMRSRDAVRRALDRGKIARPTLCEKCGCNPGHARDGRRLLHAHHYQGYDKPLIVQWLCPACHARDDVKASGENSGRAKLSLADVASIRERYRPNATHKAQEGSVNALAREYGVSRTNIRDIVKGKIWRNATIATTELAPATHETINVDGS